MTDKVLTMEDIELADDVEYAKIPGFKSDQVFCIGSLTAGDLIEWSQASEGEAKRTAGLRLICKSLVDGIPGEDEGASGKRIALDLKKNLHILRAKSHKITERIVEEILRLNGMVVLGPDGKPVQITKL